MAKKPKNLSLDEDTTLPLLKQLSIDMKVDESEIVTRALKLYAKSELKGTKTEEFAIPRDIVNQLEGAKCCQCGNDVPKGAPVQWIARGKILCELCVVESHSDKAMVKKDVLLRDTKRLVKAYETETDALFNEYLEIKASLKLVKSTEEWKKKRDELIEVARTFLKEHIGQQDEEQKLAEVMKLLQEYEGKDQSLEELMDKVFETIPKARKRKQSQKAEQSQTHEEYPKEA